MAGKKINYEVDVNASDAVSEFKKVGKAAADAGKAIEKGLDVQPDTAKVDKFISNLKQAKEQAEQVGKAVESIKRFAPQVDDSDIANVVLSLRKAGVEFDAIEAKAEELGDTLKTLDSPKIKDLGDNLSTAKKGTDDLSDSARGANSAMANMVGNATQDLGALGGVAGSAGVAIGQMSEYAADATLAGEGLGSALGSMAKVAGPIAILSAGIGIATKLFGDFQKRQQEVAENTRETAEAMAEITGAAEDLENQLTGVGETAEDFGDILLASLGADNLGDALTAAHELGIEVTDLGDIIAGLGEKGTTAGFEQFVSLIEEGTGVSRTAAVAIAELLAEAGTSFSTFLQAAQDDMRINQELTGDQIKDLETIFKLYGQITQVAKDTDINKAAQKQLDLLDDTVEGLEAIQDARDRLADQGILDPSAIEIASEIYDANIGVARSLDNINTALDESAAKLRVQEALWGAVIADMTDQDGIIGTADGATDAYNQLQTELGLTNEEMDELVQQKVDEHMAEAAEAAAELALELQEANEAAADAARELGTVTARADAFAAAMERTATALGRMETDELIGFVDGMHGMGDALAEANKEGIDFAKIDIVPDTWEEVLAMPEELRPVVEAIGGFAESVNSEMGEAFAADGAPGVREWAGNTRQAVIDEISAMGLGVEEEAALIEQTLTELGLTDVQIEAAITLAGEEQARQALDIFASDIEDLPDDVEFHVKTLMANGEFIAALELINQERIRQGQDPIVIGTDVDTSATTTELDTATAPRTVDIIPRVVKEAGTASRASEPEEQTVTITAVAETADADAELDEVADPRIAQFLTYYGPPAANAEKALDAVADPRTAIFHTSYGTAAINADAALDAVADPRTATFHTNYGTAAINADAALDAVAAPRTAPIIVDLRGEEEAARLLDLLDNPRTVVITTRNVNTGSSAPAAPGGGGGTLIAPTAATLAADDGGGVGTLAAPAPMSISPVTMVAPAAAAPVTNNMAVTIQAGMIGNANEMDRIVSKALRRHVRLNGRRN